MEPSNAITLLHGRIVTGAGGGPERMILHAPHHLHGTPYRSIAAYLHPPDDIGFAALEERARQQGCDLIHFAERHPIELGVIERLLAICRENNVRIWHGNDYKSNLYGLILRRRHPLKLVTTVHGWVQWTRRTPLYYAIDRWCIRRYDRVVAVSQDLHERCLELGIPAERLTLIENGVDIDDFERRPAKARNAGSQPGRLIIGGVGRLSGEKGFHLLIEAVDRLIDQGLDLELWIAGEGDERGALERQIAAAHHPDRLKLIGFCSDIAGLLQQIDIFALSSLREGLPLAMLEAMATGVPVVAARAGGIAAFACDGEHALLCPTGSAEALAGCLARLVAAPRLRDRLVHGAHQHVAEHYSLGARMQRMVEVYDSLGLTAAGRAA